MPANAVAEEAVRNVLLGVLDPELGDNIVDLGMVQVIEIDPRSARIVTEAIPLVEIVTCTARQFFKAAGLLTPTPEPQTHGDSPDPTH